MWSWNERLRPLVDEHSPTPLYHQVFLVLKDLIRRGTLADQELLPNEIKLAELFQVSRITIKRALAELAVRGLIVRRRGVGTFVSAPAAPTPLVQGTFDNWRENLDIYDRDVGVELLDVSEVTADAQLARHLNLDVGAPVQSVTRLRKVAGMPFAHVTAWIPADVAALYSVEALASTPMLSLLDRAGIKPANAEQWISAVIAPPAIANWLGMSAAQPALLLEQVMHDRDDRPIQFLSAHYHAERFRYHVNIGREG